MVHLLIWTSVWSILLFFLVLSYILCLIVLNITVVIKNRLLMHIDDGFNNVWWI